MSTSGRMSRLQETAHADRRTVGLARGEPQAEAVLVVHRHRSAAQIACASSIVRTPLSPMFSMNDGWLSSQTNGASANSKRRSARRAVSSSGRIAKARPLKCRQTISELHPTDVVAEPGMMRGRKCPGRIETAGGYVEEIGCIEMLVRQRRAARAAEAPPHFRRRLVLARSAARKTELRLCEGDPRYDRRCRRPPARLAVANHAVCRIRGGRVTHGAAHAAALNVLIQVFSPCRGHSLP